MILLITESTISLNLNSKTTTTQFKSSIYKGLLNKFLIGFFIFFFVYTGGYKMMNIEAFQFNIGRTGIFPENIINTVSYAIIIFESLVIFSLLFKPDFGVYVYTFAMGMFTVYIIYLYSTNRYEVCGCGGILNGLKFQYHLAINLFALALGLLAINLQKIKHEN